MTCPGSSRCISSYVNGWKPTCITTDIFNLHFMYGWSTQKIASSSGLVDTYFIPT